MHNYRKKQYDRYKATNLEINDYSNLCIAVSLCMHKSCKLSYQSQNCDINYICNNLLICDRA